MFDQDLITLFYILLLPVALLYASVGHGGASGYIALMILFSFPKEEFKTTALILNLCVSSISFISYYLKGHFNWRLFFLVSVTSVPAAFLGGGIDTNEQLFKKLLALFLIFSVLRLTGILNSFFKSKEKITEPNAMVALVIGASIGFISGLIGIGGGIILTPLILILGWTTIKNAAGVSALFIFVNSSAGLAGQFHKDTIIVNENIYIMIGCVVFGGLIGGYLGSFKLNNVILKYILAFVLMIASYKLLVG